MNYSPKSCKFIMINDSLFRLFMQLNFPEVILSSSEEYPSFCMEVLMREVFHQLMRIQRIILTLKWSRLFNVLLFLTIKQKQLQSATLANLLPGTNLILGKYYDSKKCSISKNNKQELEFYNNTQDTLWGLSYLDFILDRSTNYVVHVELQ